MVVADQQHERTYCLECETEKQRGFPGGPVSRTLHVGSRVQSLVRELDTHAAMKTQCSQTSKYNI